MVHLLLAVIYLSFISLGLPDSLLGSAWPAMYGEFGVPVSYAGIISMIIAVGTVVSSLLSDRLTRRLGTGRVTAISVAMTAAALLGFFSSHSFWGLCLWAVPYGLGAGSVDASLNNYVALHYASRHMSWLHCMWGVGASLGPFIMGRALSGTAGWNGGYLFIACLQIILTAILFLSLPLWRSRGQQEADRRDTDRRETDREEHGRAEAAPGGEKQPEALTLGQVFRIPGAREVMAAFFCYSAVEQTTGLWASSYLVLQRGVPAGTAAGFASLFFLGITAGRAVSGFLTMKLTDVQMIRLGHGIVAVGIAALLLPAGGVVPLVGLALVGLGCAPIYPCIIHSTPAHFGTGRSQAIIGVQMASAYVGTCLMPPVFGLIANHLGVVWFPFYLLASLAMMYVMHEKLIKKVTAQSLLSAPDTREYPA